MSYIYEFMDLAKDKISCNCGGIERKYDPIWKKIYICKMDFTPSLIFTCNKLLS